MSNNYAVILCGGSGSRLWPLSRTEKPKQFLQIDEGILPYFKKHIEGLHRHSRKKISI